MASLGWCVVSDKIDDVPSLMTIVLGPGAGKGIEDDPGLGAAPGADANNDGATIPQVEPQQQRLRQLHEVAV